MEKLNLHYSTPLTSNYIGKTIVRLTYDIPILVYRKKINLVTQEELAAYLAKNFGLDISQVPDVAREEALMNSQGEGTLQKGTKKLKE